MEVCGKVQSIQKGIYREFKKGFWEEVMAHLIY
jgi:hypothetical protein